MICCVGRKSILVGPVATVIVNTNNHNEACAGVVTNGPSGFGMIKITRPVSDHQGCITRGRNVPIRGYRLA